MKLREIVSRLHEEGELDSPDIPVAALPPAWYIRVLSALGAWFATLFLTFFWALFVQSEVGLAIWGAGQCGLAMVLARRLGQEMLSQLALSVWLTGTCLLGYGVMEVLHLHSMGQLSLIFLLLAAIYPEALGRFLTALAAGFLAVVWLLYHSPLPMDLLVGSLALLAGGHYLHQQKGWCRGWGRRSESFAGAAVVTVLMALCTSFWNEGPQSAGPASTALLTLAVLWLVSRVVSRLQIPLRQGLWALGGVLLLGCLTFTTPGIMAGVGVVLLACETRSRWLFLLGWIYLVVFTSGFYYNLELLLLTKSLILVAVGVLLLVLRRGILRP